MSNVNPIQVQKFLSGVDYPASRSDICSHAEKQGADDNVMQTLKKLPDQRFQTPADVSKAIGKVE